MTERTALEENYIMLRKVEHRLQIMFDLQTHSLPESDDELRKLAIRMGFAEGPHRDPLEAFKADYKQKTERNRKILNYLLKEAFGKEEEIDPEVDFDIGRFPEAGGGLSEPDRTEHGKDHVSVHAPLPPLPGRDRAGFAAGHRPDARSGCDAGQPQ